jgi:hypothetical protein
MVEKDLYYLFDFDDKNAADDYMDGVSNFNLSSYLKTIDIIKETEKCKYIFKINMNKINMNKIKKFINDIDVGSENVEMYIINNEEICQSIKYDKSKYKFKICYNCETSGKFETEFETIENVKKILVGMIKELESEGLLYRKKEEYEKKKKEEYEKYCSYFGSYDINKKYEK